MPPKNQQKKQAIQGDASSPVTSTGPALPSNTFSSTAPTDYADPTAQKAPQTLPHDTSSPPRRSSGLFMSSPTSNLPSMRQTTAEKAKRLRREREEKKERQEEEREDRKNETPEERSEREKRQREEKKRKTKQRDLQKQGRLERERKEKEEREEMEKEGYENETPEERVKMETSERRTKNGYGSDQDEDEEEWSDVEPRTKRVKRNKSGMGVGDMRMGKPTKSGEGKGKNKIDYGSAGSSDLDEPKSISARKTLQPKSVKKTTGEKPDEEEDSDDGSEFSDKDVKAIQEALSASDQSGDESDLGSDEGVGKAPRQNAPARPTGTRRNPTRAVKNEPVVIDGSEQEEDDKPKETEKEKQTSPPAKQGTRECQENNEAWKPCRIPPQEGSHYCHVHNKKRAKEGKK